MKAEYRKEIIDDFWGELWLFFRKPFWFLLIFVILFGGLRSLQNYIGVTAAIQNYEWFQQQYADINATEAQIKDAETGVGSFGRLLPESRSEWSKEDKQELSRLNSILDGLRQYKQSQIAAYNAKSRMITRNLWKSNLPQSL